MAIEYTVRRSSRARRVRVSVDPHEGVRVTLPARAPAREAARAVAELRPWIERRLAEHRAARERVAAADGHVPYLGTSLRLVAETGRTRVHRRGDDLLVPSSDAREAIERWYRRAARTEIEPRVAEATRAIGRRAARVTIREQRTRWGSCSTTGALSFNWRLLLGPDEVLDYVVWHEACHLVVMDHSRRFWALLERHRPDYHAPRRWLRANGSALVLP
jgi:predicted metal-dependent hydrolase